MSCFNRIVLLTEGACGAFSRWIPAAASATPIATIRVILDVTRFIVISSRIRIINPLRWSDSITCERLLGVEARERGSIMKAVQKQSRRVRDLRICERALLLGLIVLLLVGS